MTKDERLRVVMTSPYAVGQESLALHLAEREPGEVSLEMVFEALLIVQDTTASNAAAGASMLESMKKLVAANGMKLRAEAPASDGSLVDSMKRLVAQR